MRSYGQNWIKYCPALTEKPRSFVRVLILGNALAITHTFLILFFNPTPFENKTVGNDYL